MASERHPGDSSAVRRWGSCFIFSGSLLFGVMSVLHPPTFDPYATHDAMSEIVATKHWALIHWGLAVGITLLGLGLLTLHVWLQRAGQAAFSSFATGATLVSVALWLGILVFEAAGGAALAQAFFHPTTTLAVGHLLGALWAATLATGYVGAMLLGFATLLWSIDLLRTQRFPAGFAWLGIVAGAALMIAQPLTWRYPGAALLILIPPASGFGLWLLLLSWYLWSRQPKEV